MRRILSKQGDVVDLICRHEYGDESGFVEAVYEANPGLAERGLVLPAGVEINLPDLPDRGAFKAVSLWD